MDTEKGLCSIVVPCWNASSYIDKCFQSIKDQSYKNIEVIVVDNHSTDDSREKISTNFKCLKPTVIENPSNYGFAKAVNQGIKASKGEYVLTMNLDLTLDKDFIEKMIGVVSTDHIGSASGKLYRFPEDFGGKKIIDTTGHMLLANRDIKNRGEMEVDRGQYDDKKDIFGVCAAAGLYRREMLEDIKVADQYFDEDYFASYEDTDLDWRALSRGWRSVFVPEAIGYHKRKAFGWNFTDEMISNSKRNKFLTTVKNDHLLNYLLDLPVIFSYELENVLYKHFRNYNAFILSYGKMLMSLPLAIKKRLMFTRRRNLSPFKFRKYIVYEWGDIRKVIDVLLLFALIYVLTKLMGVRNTFYLALFIFLVFNPMVFLIKRKLHR